jgi:hypothetical protein
MSEKLQAEVWEEGAVSTYRRDEWFVWQPFSKLRWALTSFVVVQLSVL